MAGGTSTWTPIPNLRMPKELMLWCITSGTPNGTWFPVDIDENQTVDDLKDKIKEKKPNALAGVDAYALTLYKVNIDVSVGNDYRRINDEIIRGVYEFIHHPKQELFPSQIMSEVFTGPDLPHEVIHILAERPTGESINSGAQ